MAAAPVIKRYLQEGGDLLALGMPAWQSPLFQARGQWWTREAYEQAIAAQRPQHMVEAFDRYDGHLSTGIQTTNLPYRIFLEAFSSFNIGRASAYGIFAIILANIAMIFFLQVVRRQRQEGTS